MPVCPKCKKELEPGTKFCDGCGTPIPEEPEQSFCPGCGAKVNADAAVCPSCGTALHEAPAARPAQEAAPAQAAPGTVLIPGINKAVPKMALYIAAGVLAAVLLIVIIASVAGGGSSSNFALYLKDGEINLSTLKKGGSREISERLFGGDAPSNYQQAASGYSLGSVITVTGDNKTIFYPDRSSDSMTIYRRSLTNAKAEPVKIDSDISTYTVNKAGSRMVYLKGDDSLYQHDMKEKSKISSDVSNFFVNEDGSKVIYYTNDRAVYLWTAKGDEKTKLVSDISGLEKVAEDLSTIWYRKDDGLYKQTVGSDEKEKIDGDIYTVLAIYDSGEAYYIKTDSLEIRLMDYVTDDMAAKDANMVHPDEAIQWPTYPDAPTRPGYPSYPSRPYYWNYETNEEYEAAYAQYERDVEQYNADVSNYDSLMSQYYDDYAAWENGPLADYNAAYSQANDAYNEAWNEWWRRSDRENLREQLKNNTMDKTQYILYYYNGKDKIQVSKDLANSYASVVNSKTPVAVVRTYEAGNIASVKLSEISSYWDVENMVNDAFSGSRVYNVVTDGTLTALEADDAGSFRVTTDGSAIYYLSDYSNNAADLYKVTISKGSVGKPERYDSDVSSDGLTVTSYGSVLYFKDVTYASGSYKGDLYLDKTLVDYEVYTDLVASPEKGLVRYYTEWSDNNSCGTLMISKNGNKTKVSDDVRTCYALDGGSLLYLYDMSTSSYKGTLCLYKNGKSEKLDEDVSAIIPIVKSGSMRGSYGRYA